MLRAPLRALRNREVASGHHTQYQPASHDPHTNTPKGRRSTHAYAPTLTVDLTLDSTLHCPHPAFAPPIAYTFSGTPGTCAGLPSDVRTRRTLRPSRASLPPPGDEKPSMPYGPARTHTQTSMAALACVRLYVPVAPLRSVVCNHERHSECTSPSR